MNNVKDSIGWADYTWNPVVGCKRGCPYCYARRIFQRFNKIDKFEDLKFYPKRLSDPYSKKEPVKIFVGSMTDICYWEPEWVEQVLAVIKQCPQHKFMFLTKDGTVYGHYDFPENCWLGITYTDNWKFEMMGEHKTFISVEPLTGDVASKIGDSWDLVIVGGLTPKPVHKMFWVDKIIERCNLYKRNYYLKKNLHYKESKIG